MKKRNCKLHIKKPINNKQNAQSGNMNQIISKGVKTQAHRFTILLYQLNLYTAELLEQLAKSLDEQEKTLPPTSNQVSSSNRFRTHISTSTTYRLSNKHNNVVNGADNAHV
ncbi:hypothetical protein ILUMI_26352 [Ignelater luminosus]|uniref:Uncharacterized protein n=1 Tax=Ignelater luminosus TaxID=2038154 RepID=A0A8K0FVY4_IGNLU|nr:hypothetical protein ILUMI_26352 [Ignelater luminosus]